MKMRDDPSDTAVMIAKIATGEIEDVTTDDDPQPQQLGRLDCNREPPGAAPSDVAQSREHPRLEMIE